ncbi:MAG TPA: zf-HC2 domain-containing protein [Gemmatimonadales bacterium]|jgi:hypothetical protein
MRHIPEDELHAYLDQALSRNQCVEIESHLADCHSCQATRDGIAALRDRTTALLARLAPPRSISPSYESLRRRADVVVSARRRRMRAVAWAASLVVAVGLGYGASVLHRPGRVTTAASSTSAQPTTFAAKSSDTPRTLTPLTTTDRPVRQDTPAPAPRTAESSPPTVRTANASPPTADAAPAAADSSRAHRESVLAVLDPVPAVELTKLDPPRESGEEFGGMWRTLSWDGAQAEAGKPLPHIDGLPIMQVQVQRAEGTRPLMVVAQQLTSGQVIRTIEGSATDVSQLLSRRQMSDVDSVQLRGTTRVADTINADHAMAMQLGDRMLAITGDLPSDSLRAMIRRMNAEMRSK